MSKLNQKLVAEGKKILATENKTAWDWGDWALKIAPIQKNKAPVHGVLTEYAEEIGYDKTTDTLVAYRHVAAAWPAADRVEGALWVVHQTLAAHKDKIKPGMSNAKARKAAGRKNPHPTVAEKVEDMPEKEKAEVGKAVLGDAEAIEKIAQTQAGRDALIDASDVAYEIQAKKNKATNDKAKAKAKEEAEAKGITVSDDPSQDDDSKAARGTLKQMDVVFALLDSRKSLRKAAELAPEWLVTDKAKQAALEVLGDIQDRVEFLTQIAGTDAELDTSNLEDIVAGWAKQDEEAVS